MRPTSGFLNHRLFVAPLFIVLLCGLNGPALAQSPQERDEAAVAKAFKDTKWTQGPAMAPLEKIAQIQIPENYQAANGEDTRRLMETMQNPPSGREVGIVFHRSGWFVVFEFDDIGYVKDDEKGSLDPSAMLESIKHGTEAANKERAKHGWPPVTIVGWEQPPRYDEQTHNLTWAIRGESRGVPIVNYNTRLLGRNGVMQVTLVTDPSKLSMVLPDFRGLLSSYSFTKGNRYAEWVRGDKTAQIGLAALVTGGAAAVAVKSGLFKYLWKILLVAGAGFAAFFKKIFKRNTA